MKKEYIENIIKLLDETEDFFMLDLIYKLLVKSIAMEKEGSNASI